MPRIAPSADWMSSQNESVFDEEENVATSPHDHGHGTNNRPPQTLASTSASSENVARLERRFTPRRSFASNITSSNAGDIHLPSMATSFDPAAVRASTVQLSSMVLLPSQRRRSSAGLPSSSKFSKEPASPIDEGTGDFDLFQNDVDEIETSNVAALRLEVPVEPLTFPRRDDSRSRSISPKRNEDQKPSGISLLLAKAREGGQMATLSKAKTKVNSKKEDPASPNHQKPSIRSLSSDIEGQNPPSDTRSTSRIQISHPNETTPLLITPDQFYASPLPSLKASSPTFVQLLLETIQMTRKLRQREIWKQASLSVLSSFPAVIIGLLLNVLDGISYGIILFPASDIFAGFGSLGVSMFFVTTIIAQLTYSLGGSAFVAVNGSMMIEVVPFFAILVQGITAYVGEGPGNEREVIATTMVAFALSSVLTGIAFLLLGAMKLGALIGFFPRHILLGCIGGIGWFLIETGFEVAAGLNSTGFEYSSHFFRLLFMDAHILSLWLPALGLAVVLKLITNRWKHQLIFPMYFLAIPVVFYLVLALSGTSLDSARNYGWVFDIGQSEPWWQFYTYFDFQKTNLEALWFTMPTQLALLFFNVLHPPLNVPALAVSLDKEVDLNRELVAHGYSNLLAGVCGTVPNYEVYINTILFYRVGGGTRLAGLLLAAATFGLLVVGTSPIGFIPIMLVCALIFVLGIDLVKEAVWDTRHRVSRIEYVTILSIMVVMTVYDFVIGVLFGILISCFFFVVQSSRSRSIRALYTGDRAMSSVRRPGTHRAYIREVAKQTVIVKLQGFLFFGTCTYVEETIRKLLDPNSWSESPIRFLVVDLSLVPGVDVSSAEALVRIQRILASRQAFLVLCGFRLDSSVGKSLASVELLKRDNVEMFVNFNEALEWTENAYLRAYFMTLNNERYIREMSIRASNKLSPPFILGESYASSPRRSQIHTVASRTLSKDATAINTSSAPSEPLTTLVKAFSSYGSIEKDDLSPLCDYLRKVFIPKGTTLWHRGDEPKSLYIIESGVLIATYAFTDQSDVFAETMVSGAITGELSFLSGTQRNATVCVDREQDAVLWELTTEAQERLEDENPEFAKFFVRLVLKAAKVEYDVLMASLATARQ